MPRHVAPILVGALLLAGCGGSGGTTVAIPGVSTGTAPSAETVKQWPTKWCQVQVGMTRDQVRSIMGEPTEEYAAENTPAGFQPQMVYEGFEFHFTAFFDVNDRVRQLDVNDIELSAAEKSSIHCPDTRG